MIYLRSKFFFYRLVSYFSFLLIPLWIQKSLYLNQALLCFMMALYVMFMMGQWFLLGKEVDYRLKIYFRINSSIDRVVYRLFLGMILFIVYFNLLTFLPSKWIYNSFWVTWVILGLFYSWPTRGKIIQESVSTNFNEFRYLDSFEKTLLCLAFILYFFSIPELPAFTNIEELKVFFDPLDKFSPQFWNFLTVNYFPFKKYPALFKIAWSMHFYFVGTGLFLVTFYALLRFFLSRRLSLLGVFALLSSWSFSKILANNFGDAITTTYSLLWIWTILWAIRSSTYRSGLFLGLVGYFGAIIDPKFSFLVFFKLCLLYYFFLKDKTMWFRGQLIKYTSLGLMLIFITLILSTEKFEILWSIDKGFFSDLVGVINRKAFFSLSIFGLLILASKLFLSKLKLLKNFHFDVFRIKVFLILISVTTIYCIFLDVRFMRSFSLMWVVTLFSLIPLELLFQMISRLRSNRNIIYLVYILICLLDSHFEERVKIFLRFFHF